MYVAILSRVLEASARMGIWQAMSFIPTFGSKLYFVHNAKRQALCCGLIGRQSQLNSSGLWVARVVTSILFSFPLSYSNLACGQSCTRLEYKMRE